jgi:hypothetical protein
MRTIGRLRAEIVVTDYQCAALGRLTKHARVNRAVAFRARIVLARIDSSDAAVALCGDILACINAHNDRDTPFKWVKTADEIIDSMRRFGLRIQQVTVNDSTHTRNDGSRD